MSDWFFLPQFAWALVLVPALAWAWRSAERDARQRRAQALGPRWTASALPSRAGWWSLGCLGVVLAAMQPQWGDEALTGERRGSDVIVCLDVSRSMLAADQAPSRLAAARRDLAALVASGPDDRFALFAFAGETRRLVPLTDDHVSYLPLIDLAEPQAVRRGGTDLAQAVAMAERALPPESERAPVIVLLTDGEDLEGRARDAARELDPRVRVHTVGYGTAAGAKIVIEQDGQQRFVQDEQGRDVVTRLQPGSLRELAEASGGSYRDAAADPELRSLRARLLEDAPRLALQDDDATKRRARFAWPLLLALLCFAWAGREGVR